MDDLNRAYRQYRVLELLAHSKQPMTGKQLIRSMAAGRRAALVDLEQEIGELVGKGAPIFPQRKSGITKGGWLPSMSFQWIDPAIKDPEHHRWLPHKPFDWGISRRLTHACLVIGDAEGIAWAVDQAIDAYRIRPNLSHPNLSGIVGGWSRGPAEASP